MMGSESSPVGEAELNWGTAQLERQPHVMTAGRTPSRPR